MNSEQMLGITHKNDYPEITGNDIFVGRFDNRNENVFLAGRGKQAEGERLIYRRQKIINYTNRKEQCRLSAVTRLANRAGLPDLRVRQHSCHDHDET